ncbi:MAG: polyribonucleotide nucleotidyltransferase [Acidimicrobiales bacterium]
MSDIVSVSSPVTGDEEKSLGFEAGRYAFQADGAVVGQMGNTQVLVTATANKRVREGIEFFPLTVDVEERSYAAGKIPGSFFRREGRASEQAILTCRLTDRPLRPSFPDGFRNDVHVVATVLSADQENPYDVLTINAASAALCISGIPFDGPLGAVRVAYSTEGEWIPHPTYQEGEASTFEMVVAGRITDDGEVAVMMVEAGGTENAWDYYEDGAPKVNESVIAGGLDASKTWIREAIEVQRRLIAAAGVKPPIDFDVQVDYSPEVRAAVEEVGRDKLTDTQKIADKAARSAAEDEAKAEIRAALADRFADLDGADKQVGNAIRALTKEIVRSRIVNDGVRIDGRGVTDIRQLSAEVGMVAMAHGSGLFQRGETQVLNVTTLGTGRMDQMIDGIDPTTRKRYMHHYNFPPFSTGEAGFMRGPKRREIGHGALAERALLPVVPKMDEFPYTIRLVSEALSSNGSTSMASVCGSSLSMMDAGVPIKAAVGGIAMGLVHHEGKYTTLTDILGAEDAFGDMDFKVAGTEDFVTALQLDTKISGIPADVLAAALEQAYEARMKVLEVMSEAISEPREDVGPTAPKIVSFEIPADKIGEVIGPKGKVIKAIQEDTGAEINVDDDGMVGVVSVASADRDAVDEAERQIRLILDPPQAEVGAVYMGRVVNITSFGAFVNLMPGRDGLLHISKIGGKRRIDKVEDELNLGDEIEVRVDDIDPQGKISLTPTGDDDGGSDDSGSDDSDSSEDSRDSDDDRGSRGGRDGGRSRDRGDSDDDRGSRGGRDRDRDRDRGRSRDRGGRDRGGRDGDSDNGDGGKRTEMSFEEDFRKELEAEVGDLGPAQPARRPGRGGGGRGGGGGGRGGRRRR